MNRTLIALFLSLAFATQACASTGSAITFPKFQAFDSNGDPLAAGLIYSYVVGTTTPKALYTDRAITTPATNPVVLDSSGMAEIYGDGAYKLVLKNSAGATQWTIDNYRGFGDASVLSSTSFNVVNSDESPSYSVKAGGNGLKNILIGDSDVGSSITSADYCIGIGDNTLKTIVDPVSCLAMGYGALETADPTIGHCLAFGTNASNALTSGNYTLSAGTDAGRYNQTGSGSICLGFYAGRGVVSNSHSDCFFAGTYAGKVVAGATDCIGIGNSSLYTLSSAVGSIGIGENSLYALTSGNGCIGIGGNSGKGNVTGVYDISIGEGSGGGTGSGGSHSYGIAIGYNTLTLNQTGSYNVGAGANTLSSLTSGSYITAIGSNAARSLTTADGGTYIGNRAGAYETLGNKVFIDGLDRSTEAASRSNSLIYGVLNTSVASQVLYFNAGNVAVSAGNLLVNGGNLLMNGATLSGNMDGGIILKNCTAASTDIADSVQIHAVDTAGESTSTLSIYTEQIVESGAPTPSHKLKIRVNGTEYWLSLDEV